MAASSVAERFWRKVEKSRADGCWIWTASTDTGGYGRVRINGRLISCHRFSYQLTHGTIPAGLNVLHRCDVRRCVNPAHLFLGTQADNSADRIAKGRPGSPGGGAREQNGRARLTSDQVNEIRRLYGAGAHTHAVIAERYGVSESTVQKAITGQTWGAK